MLEKAKQHQAVGSPGWEQLITFWVFPRMPKERDCKDTELCRQHGAWRAVHTSLSRTAGWLIEAGRWRGDGTDLGATPIEVVEE